MQRPRSTIDFTPAGHPLLPTGYWEFVRADEPVARPTYPAVPQAHQLAQLQAVRAGRLHPSMLNSPTTPRNTKRGHQPNVKA